MFKLTNYQTIFESFRESLGKIEQMLKIKLFFFNFWELSTNLVALGLFIGPYNFLKAFINSLKNLKKI